MDLKPLFFEKVAQRVKTFNPTAFSPEKRNTEDIGLIIWSDIIQYISDIRPETGQAKLAL